MHDPMKYGKARGMKLLEQYLPNVVPFSDLRIVTSYDEWREIRSGYGNFVFQRVDLPIGETASPVSNTNGFSADISRVLNEAKLQNPNSVLLVMNTKQPTCCRYLYDGGFNVLFKLNDLIVIELVGAGFDGHELTRGLAVHERYIINWNDVPFIGDTKSLIKTSVAKYFVSPYQYTRQRMERVNFLVKDCQYKMTEVERYIPMQVERLHDTLIKSLFDDIILPILEQKEDLSRNDLIQFCIQGNFVHSKVQPWEMVTDKRWIS